MQPPLIQPALRTWAMSDGYALVGRVWQPAAALYPPALYLHGIQSHGGWFEWSASVLADAGMPVVLPDRRGSGANTPARGDTPSWRCWLADLDELAAWTRTHFAAPQVALVGVSWGGKLAVAWSRANPTSVARQLLVAPGLFPAVDVGVLGRLRVAAALPIAPRTSLPIPLGDPALFTSDPQGQRFIADDQLKLTRATARFMFHSALLDRAARRRQPFRTPTTLVLMSQDCIIANEPTTRWFSQCAGPQDRLESLTGDHTPEFAAQTSAFERLLRDWAAGSNGCR